MVGSHTTCGREGCLNGIAFHNALGPGGGRACRLSRGIGAGQAVTWVFGVLGVHTLCVPPSPHIGRSQRERPNAYGYMHNDEEGGPDNGGPK